MLYEVITVLTIIAFSFYLLGILESNVVITSYSIHYTKLYEAILSLLVLEKGWQLKHKSIAIVGVGNVGSKVSTLAKAFGLRNNFV